MVIGTTMATVAVLLVICVMTIVSIENTAMASSPPPAASGTIRSATNFAVPVSLSTCPSAKSARRSR